MAITNQKKTELKVNMTLKVVRFTIKSSEAYQAVVTYFKDTVKTPSTQGKGVMRYSGFENEDGSIFIGECLKLDLRTLMFSNERGSIELDKFRDEFINLTANKKFVEKMNVTSFEGINVQFKYGTLINVNDFEIAATNTVQSQQKTVPKISLDSNVLYIGGKSGANNVAIKITTNSDQTIRYIVSTIKSKEKSCNIFWQSLQNSISSPTTAVLGACVVNQLGRATQSPLLNAIIKHITKNNDLGKVIVSQQELSKSTTKSGKFIKRALSGVKSKLYNSQSTLEGQLLFLEWFMLLFKPEKKIKPVDMANPVDFLNQLSIIANDKEWQYGCPTNIDLLNKRMNLTNQPNFSQQKDNDTDIDLVSSKSKAKNPKP